MNFCFVSYIIDKVIMIEFIIVLFYIEKKRRRITKDQTKTKSHPSINLYWFLFLEMYI